MNKNIRKFGFKTDQQGIINRYIRESEQWQEHLVNTKNYIIESAKLKNKENCFVIGSGWLLDVPIDELSMLFKKVTLIDIVHPRQITHKIKKYKNVETIEIDITGFVEPVYYFMKKTKKQKLKLSSVKQIYSELCINKLKNADFVISVNILNQLDILICDYIKRYNIYTDTEIDQFRKTIQQNHLDILPVSKSCLITDYKEVNLNEKMEIINSNSLIYVDLPENKKTKKWQWNFDMSKTYQKNAKTIFKVKAIEL